MYNISVSFVISNRPFESDDKQFRALLKNKFESFWNFFSTKVKTKGYFDHENVE